MNDLGQLMDACRRQGYWRGFVIGIVFATAAFSLATLIHYCL